MCFKSNFTTPAVAAISFCLIGGTVPAAADILHVPGDFPTIQEAIDAAVDGDEVVVADAVYTGPNNKNLNFNGRLITVRSENGPANCIIDCEDDGRGFFFNSGETATATVQGFTIKNGYVNESSPAGTQGAGIYILNSSPTVTNCRFIACSATWQSFTSIARGGGLYSSGGSPLVNDCFFSQNVAAADEYGWGGGMYLAGGSPVVIKCDFLNGNAGGTCIGFGGGVYNVNSSPTFINCTFSRNGAGAADCMGLEKAGGGGMYNSNSDSLVINCSFTGNHTQGWSHAGGGGMYNRDSSPTLIDCVFTANDTYDLYGGIGGGMYNWNRNPLLINCTFSWNAAAGAMDDGFGGALAGTSVTAVNCLFHHNDAANGGAVTSGAGTFINCVMADNSADIGGGFRGGANATLTNCIIWNNTPDQINGSPTVTYSDIEGGFPGTGNIDADPLFVVPGGNYRLSSGSPCIDAAANTAVPKDIDTDLDGNPRFIDDPDTKDTGLGDCPIVDMGSFEFQEGTAGCCLGDLDGNNDVGVGDMLILLAAWGVCDDPANCPADFDNTNVVGVADLLILLANWGPCP